MRNKLVISFLLVTIYHIASAQQSAYFDAAQAYNKLVIEKNNGRYMRIDNYKVVGTPYLFGEKNRGDLFAKGETAYNIFLSYNTYNREIEFYGNSNPSAALIKEPHMVDSFILKQNPDAGIFENIKFIGSEILGAKDKSFYQLMYSGNNFNLYKRYKSILGIVSTNYIQSELRQFDLSFEYFYLDNNKFELKKIKPTNSALIKEFKSVKDISAFLQENNITANPDIVLKAIFASLNNQ